MAKEIIGHVRVTTPRLAGAAGLGDARGDGLAEPGDIAEQICATAYTAGKAGGVFTAALDGLARGLEISQAVLNEGLAAGIRAGWLRQRGTQVELTAAGIYIAKMALKLPT